MAWAAIPLSLAAAAVVAERCAVVSMFVARRTDFVDRPTDYKAHASPTPYLGGAAVLTAILVAVVPQDGVAGRFEAILACTAMLWLVGTIDDWVNLPPQLRLVAEVGAGAMIWSANLGFTTSGSHAINLGLTILWIVAMVNAFNLMDNIDGACACLTAVSAGGVGAAALAQGDSGLAVVSVAVAGACLGFLRHNIAGHARIFLGDGGSMPLGFLIASLTIALVRRRAMGAGELLACAVFAGLPILDTTLVVISRLRRHVNLFSGGRDHLTHRLLPRLGTASRVALTLAAVQAVLVTLAASADQIGAGALIPLGIVALALGTLALLVLESPAWAPPAPSAVAQAPDLGAATPSPARRVSPLHGQLK